LDIAFVYNVRFQEAFTTMRPSVFARPVIFVCLPLATNLLATLAIGCKAW